MSRFLIWGFLPLPRRRHRRLRNAVDVSESAVVLLYLHVRRLRQPRAATTVRGRSFRSSNAMFPARR